LFLSEAAAKRGGEGGIPIDFYNSQIAVVADVFLILKLL
jgi:hypothetical protein